jgi:hypothetical protein
MLGGNIGIGLLYIGMTILVSVSVWLYRSNPNWLILMFILYIVQVLYYDITPAYQKLHLGINKEKKEMFGGETYGFLQKVHNSCLLLHL